ncbi:MAG: hypothetical protein KF824_06100 [Fimbriimonadaceae bacterium]|nr:MAG: hypothetical protein KF824_06100 [Fimbriimonadaceae bacterium]
MKIFGQLIALSLMAGFVLSGCNKSDTPLVPNKTASESTTGSENPTAPGDATDVALANPSGSGTTSTPGLPGGTAPAIPQKTENPSIDSDGKIIKHEEGRPAPVGRVWCENCKGHLPKEDAVTKNGKTYCPACAAELKL